MWLGAICLHPEPLLSCVCWLLPQALLVANGCQPSSFQIQIHRQRAGAFSAVVQQNSQLISLDSTESLQARECDAVIGQVESYALRLELTQGGGSFWTESGGGGNLVCLPGSKVNGGCGAKPRA